MIYREEVPKMQVFVRIKAVGKRRDVLEPSAYTLPDHITSLRQLLTAVVESEVERYHRKETDLQLVPFLTARQVEEQAEAGKVSFGRIYSDGKADRKTAVENAIRCWQDGLVRVFVDEAEATELDGPLSIRENAVLTFIRLTFLAGRMW